MMLFQNDVKHPLGRVFETNTPEGLFAIHRPDCAAMIWKRSPLACFQSWINGLAPEQLPKTRLILPPENVRAALLQICKKCDTPNCTDRDRLIDDAAALAAIFSSIFHAPSLRICFDVITTNDNTQNGDQNFHIDAVTPHLICNYRGADTQYGLTADGGTHQDIFTLPSGVPILFRGQLSQGLSKHGLNPSSLPLENLKETRLVLVIAPMSAQQDKPRQDILH